MRIWARLDDAGIGVRVEPSGSLSPAWCAIYAMDGARFVLGRAPFADADGDFCVAGPVSTTPLEVWFPSGALPDWGDQPFDLLVRLVASDQRTILAQRRVAVRGFAWRWLPPKSTADARPWIGLALAVAYADGAISRRAIRHLRDQFTDEKNPDSSRALIKHLTKLGPPRDLDAVVDAATRRVRRPPADFIAGVLCDVATSGGRPSDAMRAAVRDIARRFGPEVERHCAMRLGNAVPTGEDAAWGILGVPPGCSRSEARNAYHRLARVYHPDRYAQLPPEMQSLATQKMQELNRAWEHIQSAVEQADEGGRHPMPTRPPDLAEFGAGAAGPWFLQGDSSREAPDMPASPRTGGNPIAAEHSASALDDDVAVGADFYLRMAFMAVPAASLFLCCGGAISVIGGAFPLGPALVIGGALVQGAVKAYEAEYRAEVERIRARR